jgi:hypothetical protein
MRHTATMVRGRIRGRLSPMIAEVRPIQMVGRTCMCPRTCLTDGDIALTHATGHHRKQTTKFQPGDAADHHRHPTAANVASMEMAGSLAMQSGPVLSSPTPTPSPESSDDLGDNDAESARQSHTCCLNNGHGETFGATVHGNRTRHIKTHFTREMRRIKSGLMDLSVARVIRSEEELHNAEELLVPCPYSCRGRGGRPTAYSRRGHLQRHLGETCDAILNDEEIEALVERVWPNTGRRDPLSKKRSRRVYGRDLACDTKIM